VLFNVIISIVVEVIASGIKISVISTLYFLAVLVPSTAIASRRLHDIGKSFYWLLIALIPIIGTIWIIVLLAKKGNTGDNKYGSDPKVAQA